VRKHFDEREKESMGGSYAHMGKGVGENCSHLSPSGKKGEESEMREKKGERASNED